MKYAYLTALVLSLASCSASGDTLASDCAKISAVIHKPVTVDFKEAEFAAQLRTLEDEVNDGRLTKQLGIMAEHWERFKPGPIEDLQKSTEDTDRVLKADDELTRICEKTGQWRTNRPQPSQPVEQPSPSRT